MPLLDVDMLAVNEVFEMSSSMLMGLHVVPSSFDMIRGVLLNLDIRTKEGL